MTETPRDRALDRVRLIDKHEVAELLGLKPRTVLSWARLRRGGFPAPVRLGVDAGFKWRLIDIQQFVERSLRHPPPPRPRRGHLLQGPKPKERVRLNRKPVQSEEQSISTAREQEEGRQP